MMLAQRETQADHPGAWALMCDTSGNVAEGAGCNFFMVREGEVYTPETRFVLAGVSRQVVFEICEDLGLPLNADLDTVLLLDEKEGWGSDKTPRRAHVAATHRVHLLGAGHEELQEDRRNRRVRRQPVRPQRAALDDLRPNLGTP